MARRRLYNFQYYKQDLYNNILLHNNTYNYIHFYILILNTLNLTAYILKWSTTRAKSLHEDMVANEPSGQLRCVYVH